MIAAWMLYSLAVGAVLAVAALAADRCARLLRLPARGVWLAALLATSLLSFLALGRMATAERPSPAPHASAVVSHSPGAVSAPGMASAMLTFVRSGGAAAAAAAERSYAAVAAVAGGGRGLLIGWVLTTAGLLFIGGATLARLYRARRHWREHRVDGVSVLVSGDFGPAVVGLLRPAIVVPPWLLERPAEWQRLVVHHEDEHRRAGDPLLLCVACLAVGLLPWNLALWWLLRRTRLAVELDCDARVLRRGAAPLSYGSLLLDIAGHARPRHLLTPAITGSPVHLERRLLAMSAKSAAPHRARAASAGLATLLLGALACSTDMPTATAVEEMDVAAAQAQAEQAGLLPAGQLPHKTRLFILDGTPVSEEVAMSLAPEEIESIEVLKGEAALQTYGARGEQGVVKVKTRQPAGEQSFERRPHLQSGADSLEVTGYGATPQPGGDTAGAPRVTWYQRPDSAMTRHPGPTESDTVFVIRRHSDGSQARPLMIIDGKIMPESWQLSGLPPEHIQSISVLKGDAAADRYGARGANGVILITTKAGAAR